VLPELGYQLLSECKPNTLCTLMGVAQDSTVFLQLVTKLDLKLGAKLNLLEINSFDRSISVSIEGKSPVFISHEVAKNILVKI